MSNIRSNAFSWHMIATIGVSIVIAGQFSGWNFGLAYGWKNMLFGTAMMFLFYIGFLQLVAEMGSTWPSAGGLAKYTSLAFGKLPGGMVNVSMAISLIAGTGIVGGFITSYGESILGIDSITLKILIFVGILALHLAGKKEALWMVLLAGCVAVLTLLGFAAVSLPNFEFRHLSDNQSQLSVSGIIQAIPFALWMFVGVEQAVTASEETRDPKKDLPRGLILAILILSLTAAGVLFSTIGLGGLDKVASAGDPLLVVLDREGFAAMHSIIGMGVIFGLLAGFFSLSYSASRQIVDLSRSHFFPAIFSRFNRRGIPTAAFLMVMLVGFGISFINPEKVLLAMVVLFTATYFLTALAYLRLHYTHASVERHYRARGGVMTGIVTLILSCVIVYACFSTDFVSMTIILAVFILVLAYHFSKRRDSLSAINKL